MIVLQTFPTGPIQANCTILGDREAGEAVIIDPGDEAERILEKIRDSGLHVTAILHTHAHMDHAGATSELAEQLPPGTPIALHREDLPLYEGLQEQGALFGIEVVNPPPPTLWLDDGQEISVGTLHLEVRHTPGHSPGSVCFILREPDAIAIVGDVLFAGSIGRTDLWGGSFEILEKSIRTQLYTLDDSTRVICGHGPDTTIGKEKNSNPFVRES